MIHTNINCAHCAFIAALMEMMSPAHALMTTALRRVAAKFGRKLQTSTIGVVMKDDNERPQVGDLWEGTGTHRPRIRIEAHDEHDATITLVRSGKRKRLALSTIRTSYRLIERNPQRVEHYP